MRWRRGGGVVNHAEKAAAEIALPFLNGRNIGYEILRIPHAKTLIIAEEKRAVLDDRTTQGESELVLAKRWLGLPGAIIEKSVGVEIGITQKFEQRAMQPVSTPLGLHADDSARGGGIPRPAR